MDQTPQSGVQLDPFLLPSPTAYRFVLLMVVVAAVTCLLYAVLHNSVPSNWDRRMQYSERCQAIPNPIMANGLEDTGRGGQLRDECMAPVNLAQGLWMLSGLGLLSVVAFGLYWSAAQRKLRRDKLEPISPEDAPEVLHALEELCQTAGLDTQPNFVWSPTCAAVSGVAFGRLGHYYVALTGGLVGRFYTDPAGFRAIVLHELAHIYNRDIERTYLAVATWRAFLIVVLVPLVISRFFVPNEHPFGIAWRLLALSALVLLTRNDVLRTREFYADLRACAWQKSSDALVRMLANLRESRRRWLPVWFDFHPRSQERQAIVRDCTPLFQPDFLVALATGTTAAIAVRSGSVLFADLFVARFSGWFERLDPGQFVASAIVGSLAAYVLGSELWESALLSAAGAREPSGGVSMGVGLALGTLLGGWLDLTVAAIPLAGINIMGVAAAVGASLLVFVLTTKGFADSVHAWLMLGGRRRTLKIARTVSISLYALLLSLWLAAWTYAQFAIIATDSAVLLAQQDKQGEFKAMAPLLPLILTGMTLASGIVPTLTMLILGSAPFIVRLGTSAEPSADTLVQARADLMLKAWPALFAGVAAGILPLVVSYLQGGNFGVMSLAASGGLSFTLIAASIVTAVVYARKAHVVGWLHAMTAGLGAGAITWAAVWATNIMVNASLQSFYAVNGANGVVWLVALAGLIAKRKTLPARGE